MATFYLRTLAEAIDDGLVCAEPCGHVDCAAYRRDAEAACRYCGEPAAGHSCFIENGAPVHAACVVGQS